MPGTKSERVEKQKQNDEAKSKPKTEGKEMKKEGKEETKVADPRLAQRPLATRAFSSHANEPAQSIPSTIPLSRSLGAKNALRDPSRGAIIDRRLIT